MDVWKDAKQRFSAEIQARAASSMLPCPSVCSQTGLPLHMTRVCSLHITNFFAAYYKFSPGTQSLQLPGFEIPQVSYEEHTGLPRPTHSSEAGLMECSRVHAWVR